MEQDIVSPENLQAQLFTLLKVGDKSEYNWADITKWSKTPFLVDPSKEENVHILLKILNIINSKFSWYNSLEVPIRECLTETLKSLRIYVTNAEVARYLVHLPEFYKIIRELMQCIFTRKNGQELYTKYLFHLILNLLSVGSEEQRRETRELFQKWFLESIKLHFIGEYGCLYETSAILYNLLSDVDLTNEGLINHILLYYGDEHKQNEYLQFLMEKLINADFLWQIYEDLNVKARLALLSYLREVLIYSESSFSKVKILPVSCLERLAAVFNKSSNVIFQVTQAGCTNASQEVSYILELLSHSSSEERSLQLLQNNKELFINSGMLLLNVHRLGKISDNIFTPIQKVTQNEKLELDETRNPVYGFKADLVRLIGNLCWKNRRIQDLAREAEVIQVILDCCNIDEKNPFIMQWAILAIRNICENNRENQAIIAAADPAVLQQCAEEDLRIGMIGLDLN